jgi:glycyl-tRNA synthetase beta chain
MEFLLEVLTEELPASHVRSALEQLAARFKQELEGARIGFENLRTLGTPRRLIVVGDLAAGQEDREIVVTGPPRATGMGPDGSFTAAGKGFARSQGIDEAGLEIVKTAKGEYLGYKKKSKGTSTGVILAEAIPRVLGSLSFPKMMRWGSSPFRFSRPIHRLLCLFDGKPLDLVFEGLKASDSTVGRRTLSPGEFRVGCFAEYAERLAANRVVVDPAVRKTMIQGQIEEKLAHLKAEVLPDPGLLEELVDNVEHPLVILGTFPESFLALPLEVLSTAMRKHQKFFSVVKEKRQLPYFLGVADADRDAKGFIRSGNERVLRARLEDARFFWDRDREVTLAERAAGLRNVVFQEKLGSYEEKALRLKRVASYLCDKLGAAKVKKETVEAAGLCKADLLTEMVKEFPGLQGKMGGLYAKEEGYPAPVHQAIYEHYQPSSLDDDSPSSLPGAVLSIVDKLDSIVGVLGIGIEVSGSSDPFGLRRNAHGVCKIIFDKELRFSFALLLDKVLAAYGDRLSLKRTDVKAAALDFFWGRLRFILEKAGFRYDLVSAALGPGIDQVQNSLLRVRALDSLKASPQFEPFILMAKRVNNILRDQPKAKVNPDLFTEKEERELYSTFSIIERNALPMIARGDFGRAQAIIFKIQPILNTFFDRVLVMAEEKKLRQNRLGLLQAINRLLTVVADYSQVVVEGEKPARQTACARY